MSSSSEIPVAQTYTADALGEGAEGGNTPWPAPSIQVDRYINTDQPHPPFYGVEGAPAPYPA